MGYGCDGIQFVREKLYLSPVLDLVSYTISKRLVLRQELIEYLNYYNNGGNKAKLKGLLPAIHRQQAFSVV